MSTTPLRFPSKAIRMPSGEKRRLDAVWSDVGNSVIVVTSFLPVSASKISNGQSVLAPGEDGDLIGRPATRRIALALANASAIRAGLPVVVGPTLGHVLDQTSPSSADRTNQIHLEHLGCRERGDQLAGRRERTVRR